MLDNLMDIVRKYTGGAVNNNPAIPNDKNEAVAEQAGNSIMDTLKNAGFRKDCRRAGIF